MRRSIQGTREQTQRGFETVPSKYKFELLRYIFLPPPLFAIFKALYKVPVLYITKVFSVRLLSTA
jgi:hypothetical protein